MRKPSKARRDSGDEDESSHAHHSWRQSLGAIGPGLISGACDDDPSGIATYAQAGSRFGLSLLWSALFTFPIIAAIQEICDRTALATGSGIGELALKRFHRAGRWMVGAILLVLFIANTLNIAADLVAIGSGMNLQRAGPTWIWALLSGVGISMLIVRGSFDRIQQIFKVLAGTLIVYIVVLISVTHDWSTILHNAVIPHLELNKSYISLLVALLGTTISP